MSLLHILYTVFIIILFSFNVNIYIFTGNDFAPVEAGKETISIDKPLLYVSFHRYDEREVQYVRKLRVYVDGNGSGDGMQQLYGVMYETKSGGLAPTSILPGG